MKVFMSKEVNTDKENFSTAFELKHLAFILKLLRIFTMAAFSTSSGSGDPTGF
jgi:hypothetical protein